MLSSTQRISRNLSGLKSKFRPTSQFEAVEDDRGSSRRICTGCRKDATVTRVGVPRTDTFPHVRCSVAGNSPLTLAARRSAAEGIRVAEIVTLPLRRTHTQRTPGHGRASYSVFSSEQNQHVVVAAVRGSLMFNFECSSGCTINFISLLEHPQRKHPFESCCSDGYAGLSSLRVACVSSTVFVCVRIRKSDGLPVWGGLTLQIAMLKKKASGLAHSLFQRIVCLWFPLGIIGTPKLKPSAHSC